MDNIFSFIEIQVIKQQFSKMPAEAIADIIDKPIVDVTAKINEFSCNSGIQSFYQRVVVKNKIKMTIKKKKELVAIQKRQEKAVIIHQQFEEKEAKADKRKFATKNVDFSQMILVKIDHKTQIYLKPGDDIEIAKAKYHERIAKSKAILYEATRTHKVVKKFK